MWLWWWWSLHQPIVCERAHTTSQTKRDRLPSPCCLSHHHFHSLAFLYWEVEVIVICLLFCCRWLVWGEWECVCVCGCAECVWADWLLYLQLECFLWVPTVPGRVPHPPCEDRTRVPCVSLCVGACVVRCVCVCQVESFLVLLPLLKTWRFVSCQLLEHFEV